jgi:PIN domain nuclease of toxin-antitoxin system
VIVLDTHAWVWWVSGARPLPESVNRAIDENLATGGIRVSSISVWEVALLVKRGRLRFTMDVADWVAASEALPFVTFVPVDNRIAELSVSLPDLHDDPADRIIVATALTAGAVLVTSDERLRRWPRVTTLW